MNEKVERWLRTQQRLFQGVAADKASIITLERDNIRVASFSTDSEQLAEEVSEVIDMQADELGAGPHQYRLVALSASGVQLSELPQIIRGRNREATSASGETLQLVRAHQQAFATLKDASDHIRREMEALSERNKQLTDGCNALIDRLHEAAGSNLHAQLEIMRFEAREKRTDQLMENLAPLAILWLQKQLGGDSENFLKNLMNTGNTESNDKRPQADSQSANQPTASVSEPGSIAVRDAD